MYICVENVVKVCHVCIHYLANPGTNKDCSYANTYSINTEKPLKLNEKFEFQGFIHENTLFLHILIR
jgi:hypothetical protein